MISFLYRYYHEEQRGTLPFLTTNNLAVGMDTFARVGGFDSTFPFASEDRDWCDRFRCLGGSLVYAPEAIVHHAHPLTRGSFLRQHFRYGTGARSFHRSRARRRGTGLRLERGAFYRGMLRTPFAESDPEPFKVSALIAISQAAGALGWGVAALRDIGPRRAP